jgi:hypothetical protein
VPKLDLQALYERSDFIPSLDPFWVQGRLAKVASAALYVRPATASLAAAAAGQIDRLARGVTGLLSRALAVAVPKAPTGSTSLFFETSALDEAWLALEWKVA